MSQNKHKIGAARAESYTSILDEEAELPPLAIVERPPIQNLVSWGDARLSGWAWALIDEYARAGVLGLASDELAVRLGLSLDTASRAESLLSSRNIIRPIRRGEIAPEVYQLAPVEYWDMAQSDALTEGGTDVR